MVKKNKYYVLGLRKEMKKTIAIDCDEILANTIDGLLAFNKYTFNGIPANKNDITSFLWHEIPKFGASEAYGKQYFETFFSSSAATSIEPVPGSQAGIKTLHELGYDLRVITSRWEGTREITLDRIEKYFPGMFTDVIFGTSTIDMHYSVNKAEFMRHIGATCLVDDALHNCFQVASSGFETLLLDNPWNQSSEITLPIKRVYNREEIVDHFK